MKPEMKFKSSLMTCHEVAKYLGVHPITIYRLMHEKKIPCFKLGGRWRTEKKVLDKFLFGEFTV